MDRLQSLDKVQWQRESPGERCLVVAWRIAHLVLIRFSPRRWHRWRAFWYRRFGARIDAPADVGPRAYVARPWKLAIGRYVSLSPEARIENLERVEIGEHTVISQNAIIFNADRDPLDPHFSPIRSSVRIGAGVWIAAGAFVGPGVHIGDNAIVGACAVVSSDVPAGVIVAGDPPRVVRSRFGDGQIAPAIEPLAHE